MNIKPRKNHMLVMLLFRFSRETADADAADDAAARAPIAASLTLKVKRQTQHLSLSLCARITLKNTIIIITTAASAHGRSASKRRTSAKG
jgi:hypothetical protein